MRVLCDAFKVDRHSYSSSSIQCAIYYFTINVLARILALTVE